MADPVKLEADVTLTESRLLVEFSFLNRGDEDLFMYAHPDDGRRTEVLPGAYVCVSRERAELRFLLGVPPAPRHFDVQRGAIPLARIVTPGGRLEGSIDLPIPVREWSAYFPREYPEDSPTVRADRGTLLIEFFPTSEAGWVEPGPEEATFWTEALAPRSVVAELPFPRSVPVLERTDPFVRF